MNGSQVEVEYLIKKLKKIRGEKGRVSIEEEREKIGRIEKNLVFELGKRISEHPALKEAINHPLEIASLINPQDTS